MDLIEGLSHGKRKALVMHSLTTTGARPMTRLSDVGSRDEGRDAVHKIPDMRDNQYRQSMWQPGQFPRQAPSL